MIFQKFVPLLGVPFVKHLINEFSFVYRKIEIQESCMDTIIFQFLLQLCWIYFNKSLNKFTTVIQGKKLVNKSKSTMKQSELISSYQICHIFGFIVLKIKTNPKWSRDISDKNANSLTQEDIAKYKIRISIKNLTTLFKWVLMKQILFQGYFSKIYFLGNSNFLLRSSINCKINQIK